MCWGVEYGEPCGKIEGFIFQALGRFRTRQSDSGVDKLYGRVIIECEKVPLPYEYAWLEQEKMATNRIRSTSKSEYFK